jgi:hypothetical protein
MTPPLYGFAVGDAAGVAFAAGVGDTVVLGVPAGAGAEQLTIRMHVNSISNMKIDFFMITPSPFY